MEDPIEVAGFCPACGAAELFLRRPGLGGGPTRRIFCYADRCPNPNAVDAILSDEEVLHVVTIGETSFTTRHPLIERVGDALMACDLAVSLAERQAPFEPGVYRASRTSDDQWSLQRVTT